jgi:hypothetical protein
METVCLIVWYREQIATRTQAPALRNQDSTYMHNHGTDHHSPVSRTQTQIQPTGSNIGMPTPTQGHPSPHAYLNTKT